MVLDARDKFHTRTITAPEQLSPTQSEQEPWTFGAYIQKMALSLICNSKHALLYDHRLLSSICSVYNDKLLDRCCCCSPSLLVPPNCDGGLCTSSKWLLLVDLKFSLYRLSTFLSFRSCLPAYPLSAYHPCSTMQRLHYSIRGATDCTELEVADFHSTCRINSSRAA